MANTRNQSVSLRFGNSAEMSDWAGKLRQSVTNTKISGRIPRHIFITIPKPPTTEICDSISAIINRDPHKTAPFGLVTFGYHRMKHPILQAMLYGL